MTVVRKHPLGTLLGLGLCLTLAAYAAEPPKPATKAVAKAAPKRISAADQKAIVALFKGVESSKYHLEFNGKTAGGTRKVEMQEIEQVRKVSNPGEAQGYVVLAVKDNGVMYVFAATSGRELTEVLGAEKANQLNQIMAKYGPAAGH